MEYKDIVDLLIQDTKLQNKVLLDKTIVLSIGKLIIHIEIDNKIENKKEYSKSIYLNPYILFFTLLQMITLYSIYNKAN